MLPRTEVQENKIYIKANGRNGSAGAVGKDGSGGGSNGNGAKGTDGQDGAHGQNANSINVKLRSDKAVQKVILEVENSDVHLLTLGDKNNEIILNANGGNGGDGGRGGHGGRGGDGRNGQNATQSSRGTNGGNGGRGGKAGNGGKGGNAGDAADIVVEVAGKDIDLLMLVTPELSGGHGGSGGHAGMAGSGGHGGRGGHSYSWTTLMSVSNGRTGHVAVIPHYNSGGSSGSAGASGRSGNDGSVGSQGKDGVYNIIVPNLGTYHERYDITVVSYSIQSPDGIIEPGEELDVVNLKLKNISTMPSPPKIELSVVQNDWVLFDPADTLIVPNGLLPKHKYTFPTPLKFKLNSADKAIPAVDSTFHDVANVRFRAIVPRVQKEFARVANTVQSLEVRYPVEMSAVENILTTSRDKEAPFAMEIRNISSKPIGIKTAEKRFLGVTFAVTGGIKGKYLELYNKADKTRQTLSQPINANVDFLAPGESTYFSGTIKFTSPKTPAYTKVTLTFSLQLGELHGDEKETIQQRNFQLQLADDYHFDENADFILVTNNKMKRKTVKQWAAIAESLGTKISIWNTSLYDGLSYTKMRHDRESFVSQLKDKVIVILNNGFTTNNKEIVKSTDYLDQLEIFEAAANAGISTYVVGDGFDVSTAIMPLKQQLQANPKEDRVEPYYPEFTANESFVLWKKPTKQHLVDRVLRLNKKLEKKYPADRNMLVFDFDPKEIGRAFLADWKLGAVQIRSTLGKCRAHIAQRKTKMHYHQVDNFDVYNILKLMPFNKKLQYISACLQYKNYLDILAQAIVSDLTQELLVFGKHKWQGDFSKSTMAASLDILNSLMRYDFTSICNNAEGKQFLSELMVTYSYAAKCLPSMSDQHVLPIFKRRHVISDICKEKINEFVRNYFPELNFHAMKKQFAMNLKDSSRAVFLRKSCSPRNLDTIFDYQATLPLIASKSNLPVYHERVSTFNEGSNFFTTNKQRDKAASACEKNCKFELTKPSLNLGK